MRIASFNINGIKARWPRLCEWLTETQPDIACLQEIKCQNADFPSTDFVDIGYKGIWHGQKTFNGVAILVKQDHDIVEVKRGLDGEAEDEQARYLEADVTIKGSDNPVRVSSIYLPNGNPRPGPKFDYKLRWMERLRARAQEIYAEDIPAILAGDYNVIPRDNDVFSVKAMADDALMQPESRAAFQRILHDGWTDSIGTQCANGHVWTYWDYRAGAWQRDNGFRIDHLLLSPMAADRFAAVGVDKEHRGREKASDHAPIWVELRD